MKSVMEFLRTSARTDARGVQETMSLSLQRSDLRFSTTTPSSMFMGRNRAIPEPFGRAVMKPRRPYSSLSVCSTSEDSPTFVWDNSTKRSVLFIRQGGWKGLP